MIPYIILWPLSIIVSLICYVTNPLVLLFCDEAGELPGVLHLWQTWDDSCNPSDLKDIAPSWLQFDWDRHYYEYRDTTPALAKAGRDRCFCRVIDSHFTVWERFQRYCCRVLWLTRNNSYGFAFWLFGRNIDGHMAQIHQKIDADGKETFARAVGKRLFAPFLYKNDCYFCKYVRWCIFLGWKLDYTSVEYHRAMIAGRLAIRFGKREGDV